MDMRMLVGFGLAAGILAGLLVWNFLIKKNPASDKVSRVVPGVTKAAAKPQTSIGGLRSLKSAPLPVEIIQPAVVTPAAPLAIPKYRAMVWTDNGIVFRKIPEKIGSVFYCDPSMPEKGEHLWVTEKIEGDVVRYEPYEPREIPIVSEETPEWAFDSIHCYEIVYAWYKNKADMWDKVNTVLIGLAIGVMGLVCLVALDKVN